ncbi:FtsX-like permease family protein [Tissierella creatinini]|nr:FtsX-like permease family protein [Tissierella creatinini]TJX66119.1 FtsX-like permease family protein [Soehngenia saccharolytica]
MLRENIRMSWQNILNNKMRSFLTILGIVIGVTAIIALISIVQGVIDESNKQFVGMGTGRVTVQAFGTPLKQGLSFNDIESLSQIENVTGVSPNLSFNSSVVKDGNVVEDVVIEGKNEVYFKTTEDVISRGRVFNILDMESKNKVVMIDTELSESLFFGRDPMGENIIINGTSYSIVGILNDESSDDIMSMIDSSSAPNGKVIIPYTTAMTMAGIGNIFTIEIIIDDTNFMDQTIDKIESVLNQAFNFKEDSYNLINLDSLLDMMETLQGMMTAMLTGIAAISLLVGGIGIMNMMLVSVTERTTEIGLRKALGAEPGSIQIQFLLESIFLSLLGGIIGAILGLSITYIASDIIGIPFKINYTAIFLGVGFSAAIGIIFGWAPARKASMLNPIDALRSV